MKAIPKIDWDERWSSQYRICYHANFVFSLPKYDVDFFTEYDVYSAVLENLLEIKTYLLYFDFINIPLGSFLKPRNRFSEEVGKALFQNREFLRLAELGLIVTSVYKGQSVEDSFLARKDHLDTIKWENGTDIYEGLMKYELSNFIFYERDLLDQISYHRRRIEKKIENIINDEVRSKMTTIYRRSVGQSGLEYSRPFFYQEAWKTENRTISDFLNSLNLDHYQGSEYATKGLIVPFQPESDKLLRKSLSSSSFAFLYQIEFFKLFLSFYTDNETIGNIKYIKPDDLVHLRSDDSWSEYLNFYHELLELVSRQLSHETEESILLKSKELFTKQIATKSKNLLFDVTLMLSLIFFSKVKAILKVNGTENRLDRIRNHTGLRCQNKKAGHFLESLFKVLKACA